MKRTLALVAVLAASAFVARANVILDVVSTGIVSTDPTQTNRLSRTTATISDWTNVKAFPGVQAGTFHYQAFELALTFQNYLQISVDDPNTAVYASVWLGPASSYTGPGTGVGFLGDMGFSGNNFGNPGFFQIIAPKDSIVTVVINNVPGTLYNQPFGLLVEAWADGNYNETPEPATAGLAGLALAGIGLAARARRKRS